MGEFEVLGGVRLVGGGDGKGRVRWVMVGDYGYAHGETVAKVVTTGGITIG